MSYVAVVAFYKDGSNRVHVDSSMIESIKTMEAMIKHGNVLKFYRKVVDSDTFIAYSEGANLKADVVFSDRFGNLKVDILH